ncbi:MarR family transcriptional regulator [Periweissella cryptocerci]|uniref:MarR family transcriptional regulator n=1 Tax=Periweissella cryptocerci TaxID=2506420 RepID=A0A4V1AID4_9LACO|nr:MarR family winged helix-turn-helix transcriptional regulator [Periweissella cryptocerci]QBO35115.1 MarR family transcriptional regulator [Periweissella cryptocerci]
MKSSLEALRDAEKIQKAALMKITKKYGLTIAEWQLLSTMMEGFDTQDKLSAETGLDTSTLSRQLKSILAKEYVDKVATGRDHRQLVYTVLTTGSDAVTNINGEYKNLEDTIFDKWSNEEVNMLRILLNRLEKSMTRVTEL